MTELEKIEYTKSLWLVDIGMLKVIENSEGKKKKYPTEIRESIGISTETRKGMYREYIVVVYNREAQQFVNDNLNSVISLKNK